MYKLFFLALLINVGFVSCSEDADDVGPTPPTTGGEGETRDLTVENFAWRGMNNIYLYKADIPQLANDYFASQAERNDFLDNFETPEDLFYDGLMSSQDRFSWIVDDYVELENLFSGISTTTGMNYSLGTYGENANLVFGVVRYVLPGTSAEAKGIKRGDLFTRINGEQMTITNYSALLAPEVLDVTLATIEGNTITETGEVTLTKAEYSSNPVYITKTIDLDGMKIGYLMYNSFTDDYDEDLNDAFNYFKGENITELILDLRYNGGGSVRTATDLAAMITGQFPGEIFLKEEWNAEYQDYFLRNNPNRLVNKFNTQLTTGTAINSLNLDRVYVLTTTRSASASELIINGLEPYIDVIHIGDKTTGKFTASTTLYDSPNFGRQNASTRHTYALQPLIFKSLNANGVSDYVDGLYPDFEFKEDIRNYGVLGDENEPLLNAALNYIQGNRISMPEGFKPFNVVGESGMELPTYQKMYVKEIPGFLERE
ncbi:MULTISPECIES: S41 family peptidase [Antarcticibacterium]|nr:MULTISPECIES: S41 family peptidase [Antarcticibacterium]